MLVRMMVMAAKSVAFTCGRCGLLHWFICGLTKKGLTKKGLTKKGVRIKVQQFLVLGNFSAKLDIPSQSTNHSRNSVMPAEVGVLIGRCVEKGVGAAI